ncbi:hypothetical protein J6590_019298, partial [Homalodisca vitripennis]
MPGVGNTGGSVYVQGSRAAMALLTNYDGEIAAIHDEENLKKRKNRGSVDKDSKPFNHMRTVLLFYQDLNQAKHLDKETPQISCVAVAAFRTTTGHDYLETHLHRIRVNSDDGCSPPAPVPGLSPNLVDEEDGYREIACLNWSAHHLMANLPRLGVG